MKDYEPIAKAIYEGVCKEGVEECFHGTPWDKLPNDMREAYFRIARSLPL